MISRLTSLHAIDVWSKKDVHPTLEIELGLLEKKARQVHMLVRMALS